MLPSVLVGDTLVQQGGPYFWQDSYGGQMNVSVTVHSNVNGYPGLYVWDYEIQNISVNMGYGGMSVNGISAFWINFGGSLDDLAKLSPPPNWNTSVNTDVNGATSLAATSPYGQDPVSQQPSVPLFPISIGQTAHVRFSTLPRQVLDVSSCASTNNWTRCARAGVQLPL